MKTSNFGFTLISDEGAGDNRAFDGLIAERVIGPVRCYNPYRGVYEVLHPDRYDVFLVGVGTMGRRRTSNVEPGNEDKRHYTKRDSVIVAPPLAADLREYRRKIAAYLIDHGPADFRTICSSLELESMSLARTALRGYQFKQSAGGLWRIDFMRKVQKLIDG